jgi:phytoene desaturase
MRTVRGRTDRVVVVGAGLGGLSAALRLAGAGRQVTVLEREDVPGGRAGIRTEGGYTFDTGPTVLTMPDLIADALACVGEDMADWLTLRPLEPLYRAHYPDGSRLDMHADPQAMAAEIERVCGAREADGYRRFVAFLHRLYRCERDDFIDRNHDSPLDLLTPNLARLVAMGAFRRLAPKVGCYLRDPRTRRAYSFQALYAGVSPFQALAVYAVIAYMDSVGGVSFPLGGMHAVPRALAGAAAKHGVEFRYGCRAVAVEMSGQRAVAVRTADGERLPADVVVLNPDLPVAYQDLLGRVPRRVRRLRYSPSCFVLHAGSTAGYPAMAHHNIHFGRSWRGTFAELLDRGRLMSDPSFLVTTPTRTDPGLAPPGRHTYYVLFPTPNLRCGADLDWRRIGPSYRDEVVATLQARGYPGFGDGIEVAHAVTPLDWARQGMAAGTPFAAAHTLTQTGPFRPGNLYGENVVFTGSGTRPGVGVPMVLISGRLAAERILGRHPARRPAVRA